jgi:DUF1707 SHOCT-like domain
MSGMANVPDVPEPRSELRASDADRERVAEILRTAAAEGRLDLDELDERLALVYKAKTYTDLEPLTHDLPVAGAPLAPVPSGNRIGGAATSTGAVAIMGGFERKGTWVVPDLFTAVAFWGGGEIDLREARFATAEVELRLFAVMGGMEVVVPEDAEVIVNGIGIMGGFDHQASGPGKAGAPRIKVTGLAFWGGVSVRRLPPKEELERRRQQRRLERRQARLERQERRRLGT